MTTDTVMEPKNVPIPLQPVGLGPSQPALGPAVELRLKTVIPHILAVLGGMHQALVSLEQPAIVASQVEVPLAPVAAQPAVVEVSMSLE